MHTHSRQHHVRLTYDLREAACLTTSMSIDTAPVPRLSDDERITIDELGYKRDGIIHVSACYGYMLGLGSYETAWAWLHKAAPGDGAPRSRVAHRRGGS